MISEGVHELMHGMPKKVYFPNLRAWLNILWEKWAQVGILDISEMKREREWERTWGNQKILTRVISNIKKTASAAPNAKSKKAGCKT